MDQDFFTQIDKLKELFYLFVEKGRLDSVKMDELHLLECSVARLCVKDSLDFEEHDSASEEGHITRHSVSQKQPLGIATIKTRPENDVDRHRDKVPYKESKESLGGKKQDLGREKIAPSFTNDFTSLMMQGDGSQRPGGAGGVVSSPSSSVSLLAIFGAPFVFVIGVLSHVIGHLDAIFECATTILLVLLRLALLGFWLPRKLFHHAANRCPRLLSILLMCVVVLGSGSGDDIPNEPNLEAQVMVEQTLAQDQNESQNHQGPPVDPNPMVVVNPGIVTAAPPVGTGPTPCPHGAEAPRVGPITPSAHPCISEYARAMTRPVRANSHLIAGKVTRGDIHDMNELLGRIHALQSQQASGCSISTDHPLDPTSGAISRTTTPEGIILSQELSVTSCGNVYSETGDCGGGSFGNVVYAQDIQKPHIQFVVKKKKVPTATLR